MFSGRPDAGGQRCEGWAWGAPDMRRELFTIKKVSYMSLYDVLQCVLMLLFICIYIYINHIYIIMYSNVIYIYIFILTIIYLLFFIHMVSTNSKIYLDSWVFLALAHQLVDLKTLLTMSWRSQISIRLVGFEYVKGHLGIVLKMADTLSSGHLTVVEMMITQMEWDSQF